MPSSTQIRRSEDQIRRASDINTSSQLDACSTNEFTESVSHVRNTQAVRLEPASAFAATSRVKAMRAKHQARTAARMRHLQAAYVRSDFPTAANRNKETIPECGAECATPTQCYQNAVAYQAAFEYLHEYPDTLVQTCFLPLKGAPTSHCHSRNISDGHIFCGASIARHQVPYYDSGRFGDSICAHCKALLLRSEACRYAAGKRSACCSNGELCTEVMTAEFDELQKPPDGYTLLSEDKEFTDNAFGLNHAYAFASTSSEKATPEMCAGRADTCKYNGMISHHLSDLYAPEGRNPQFAQVYTLDPDQAEHLRASQFEKFFHKPMSRLIIAILERIMRQHPLAQVYQSAHEIHENVVKEKGSVPDFQIVLLTDRVMEMDAIENLSGCTIVQRAEAPIAKQIAVIWTSEDGLAPKVTGFRLGDKQGKLHEIGCGSPILDPAAFPLLHPRGTWGWRYQLDKRSYNMNQLPRRDEGVRQMREALTDANLVQIIDPMPGEEFSSLEEDVQNALAVADLDEDVAEEEDDGRGIDDIPDEEFAESCEGVAAQTSTRRPLPRGAQISVSQRQFYNFRMALRQHSKPDFHWLWFARKLAEFFVITVLNRIEREQLDFVKKQQEADPKRKICAQELVQAISNNLAREHAGAKLGKIFMTPKTFAGSRQYYQHKYADFMSVVHRMGKPTWFVTFTGNQEWPEIKRALAPGQDPLNRADIVCRVFMCKAREFVRDLLKRNVLGKVVASCYSVEHQKRGMPHIHMLLILDKKAAIRHPEQIDQYVCARIPPLPSMEDESEEAHQQRRLWMIVKNSMLHDCNAACCPPGRRCNKYFPKLFSDHTVLADDHLTQYKRMLAADPLCDGLDPDCDEEHGVRMVRIRSGQQSGRNYADEGLTLWIKKGPGHVAQLMDDSRVIPYNPFLTLKYMCHINVEFVNSSKACKYLFKYVLKGFTRAFVKVTQRKDQQVYDYDEISSYFKVRYLTSLEAYLRMQSFPIVSLSHTVYALPVHTEMGQNIVVSSGVAQNSSIQTIYDTRLTAFFKLCTADSFAHQLRYDQIPYYYWWNNSCRIWVKRIYARSEDLSRTRMITRIYSVSPKRQELFALRCILLNKCGPTGFSDLKLVDGMMYTTFGEAAKAMGLLQSDQIYHDAMQDAANQYKNSAQLVRYFAMLVLHCQPSDPQALFDAFLDDMYPAPAAQPGRPVLSVQYRRAKIMLSLEFFLNVNGSSASDVGLRGLPASYNFDEQQEVVSHQMIYDDFYGLSSTGTPNNDPQSFVLRQIELLNKDQTAAFDTIAEAILQPNCAHQRKAFFLEGEGGTGKTYLYNTLIRWMLAGKPTNHPAFQASTKLQYQSIVSAASTGIAALMLIDGGTVHRKFCVPNNVEEDTTSRIGAHTALGIRLRAAEVIVIDEVSMLDKHVFDYVDRALRDLCGNQELFGGKTIVAGGDWRQLAPVVEGGSVEDQIQASLKSTEYFRRMFQTLTLTQNMRTDLAEVSLRDWLKDIGVGKCAGKDTAFVEIPLANQSACLEDIIDFCFPQSTFANPLAATQNFSDSAILAPHNADVFRINDIALNKLPGLAQQHFSIDQPLDVDNALSITRADFDLENIHTLTPSGLPPHLLELKVGAPVMLIKNLDISAGLCNGTRLIITGISTTNLKCRILTGPQHRIGTTVLIPLIKFQYDGGKNNRGARFSRLQFSVRLCFALTINKAQGQSLTRMGLVLSNRGQCFAHGQLYTAFSRVRSFAGIRVFSPHYNGRMIVRNVIYRALIN